MNPNKPNFKDQNCTMDKTGKNCTPSNQPTKENTFNKNTSTDSFKRPGVDSTETTKKTNGQANKFNNFKK